MTGQVRVFLVDDDPVYLVILGETLGQEGYTIEVFERPEALLERVTPDDRGCVVMDLQMPGLDGLALQRALTERGVLLPVVFVSGSADIPDAVAAMKQGAVDFLKKPVKPEALVAMVAQAIQKDTAAAAERAAQRRAQASFSALSPRERDACRLFAKGLGVKQIAAELGIHDSTAHVHRVRGMQKLKVGTVAELIELFRAADEEPGADASRSGPRIKQGPASTAD